MVIGVCGERACGEASWNRFQYFSPADYFWVKMVFIVGFNNFFYFDRNLKLLGVGLELLSLNTLLKIF